MYLPWGWPDTGTGFLARLLIPHASQCSSGIWIMPSVTCFNFCLSLKRSGSWTRWSLKVPSNWTVLFYSLLFLRVTICAEHRAGLLATLHSKKLFPKQSGCTDPKITVEALRVSPVSQTTWQAAVGPAALCLTVIQMTPLVKHSHPLGLTGWYSQCTEQTIRGCTKVLGLICHPAEDKSCLWRKYIPYLKLWIGVVGKLRAKAWKRKTLKRASPFQFFKLGSVLHFSAWYLSRDDWICISEHLLIHTGEIFRISLDLALSRLMSLWSFLVRWVAAIPTYIIVWLCSAALLSTSTTAIHNKCKSSLKIFWSQCCFLPLQIPSAFSNKKNVEGRNGNRIMWLSERFPGDLSARSDGWRRLWLQTVRWLSIMEVTMWNHTSSL